MGTEKRKEEVNEQEKINHLAKTLRENGLAASTEDSIALAKKIIEREKVMYGYINKKEKLDHSIAEEREKTLSQIMNEEKKKEEKTKEKIEEKEGEVVGKVNK